MWQIAVVIIPMMIAFYLIYLANSMDGYNTLGFPSVAIQWFKVFLVAISLFLVISAAATPLAVVYATNDTATTAFSGDAYDALENKIIIPMKAMIWVTIIVLFFLVIWSLFDTLAHIKGGKKDKW